MPRHLLWLVVGLVASAAAHEGDDGLMTLQTVSPSGELLELRFAHGDDFEARALGFVTANALSAGEGCSTTAWVAQLVVDTMRSIATCREGDARACCVPDRLGIMRNRYENESIALVAAAPAEATTYLL